MTPERWQRIKSVFQEAAERSPAERDAYLAVETAGDGELQCEVERMLLHATGVGPLDRPAWEQLGGDHELHPGDQLGPYEILEEAGAGGMGRVYKARDTRLERTVAIKVLSAEFSHRLRTEGRAISALNHPHVCALYDIADREGYLVMEYVVGESLAQRLARGPLPVDSVLLYGAQIAGALAAAHEQGIVHRDLKPANILITASGVKVLDFGVAQIAREEGNTGGFAGTAAYMSPSQLNGNPADARSDIFALGLVLYEMTTGKRYTRGESVAIARAPELASVIAECLQEDGSTRLQTMEAARAALERLRLPAASPPPTPRRAGRWIVPASAVGIAGAAFGLIRMLLPAVSLPPAPARPIVVQAPLSFPVAKTPPPARPEPEPPPPAPFLETLTEYPGNTRDPSLSPDGTKLALSWSPPHGSGWAIYVRDVDGDALTQLTSGAKDWGPSWSPDGRSLAFRRQAANCEIDTIPAGGGSPRLVAQVAAPGSETLPQMSWSPDGRWIAAPDRGDSGGTQLYLFGATTRQRRALTQNTAGLDHAPAFSPDGRFLAYASCSPDPAPCDVMVLTLGRDLTVRGVMKVAGGMYVRGIAWAPDGRSLVYSAARKITLSTSLWRVPLKEGATPQRIEISGTLARHPMVSGRAGLLAFTRTTGDWKLMMIRNFR